MFEKPARGASLLLSNLCRLMVKAASIDQVHCLLQVFWGVTPQLFFQLCLPAVRLASEIAVDWVVVKTLVGGPVLGSVPQEHSSVWEIVRRVKSSCLVVFSGKAGTVDAFVRVGNREASDEFMSRRVLWKSGELSMHSSVWEIVRRVKSSCHVFRGKAGKCRPSLRIKRPAE